PSSQIYGLIDTFKIYPAREELLSEIFEILPTIESGFVLIYVIRSVYPHLNETRRSILLDLTRRILKEPADKAEVLLEIARNSPEPLKHELAHEAFDAVSVSDN